MTFRFESTDRLQMDTLVTHLQKTSRLSLLDMGGPGTFYCWAYVRGEDAAVDPGAAMFCVITDDPAVARTALEILG